MSSDAVVYERDLAELEFLLSKCEPNDRLKALWEIVKECGEEERHFNQLQSVYRGIASSWLVAIFGGVGFLMFCNDTPHSLAAGLICILGAFGVCLLWMLDLNIYHRLLVSVFAKAQALEKRFPYLPRIRHDMDRYTEVGVERRLTWYYMLTAVAPLVCGILLLWSPKGEMFWCLAHRNWLAGGFAVIGIVLIRLLFWRSKHREPKRKAKQAMLTPEQCPFRPYDTTCPLFPKADSKQAISHPEECTIKPPHISCPLFPRGGDAEPAHA